MWLRMRKSIGKILAFYIYYILYFFDSMNINQHYSLDNNRKKKKVN